MNGLKEAIRVCMSSQDDIHTANSSSPASFDFNLPKGAHTVRLFAIKGDFMPRNRRPKKNQTTRPRSAWGTVIPRFDENGGIIAWQVRYPNPLAPGKRVQRQFKPWQELEARTWLEEEKHLVDLHNKGIAEWKHPTQRKKDKLKEFREQEQRHILFRDYVAQWESNYKLPNGGEIAGGTRRNLKLDIRHFITDFESRRLSEITPLKIKAWYDKPHPEGQWAFRRSCMRFKAILESATKPGLDGTEPLLQFNPFIFPIPPAPRSSRIDAPPVTPRELMLLAEAMPEYTRLSVFLSTLVGGLRCGELCGLRVMDIDLDGQTLHVRRSVNRGRTDRGEIRYSRTKTESSIRNVHIPDALMPMIRQHLHNHCDMGLPESPVFVPRRAKIMSQTTLEEQFAKARVKASRPDLTFQGLRASHATLLMLRGGTLREVMNELGHTSEKVAIRYYQLTVAEHQSRIVDRLAQDFMDA